MKKLIIVCLTLASVFIAKGQDDAEKKNFGVTFSGYVKHEAIYETRQTYALREGYFHLWPLNKNIDALGKDINKQPTFNMFALQSRLSAKISGPDAFGAKTSGVIEGDFFAQGNANIHLFRLRHAFIKLNWTNTELITGQYWNPFFVTGCFPGTVAFTTGTPFQSFNRSPQVRLTQTLGGLSIMGAVLSQRDYSNWGPDGLSSIYLRNSGMPELHAQVQFATKNKEAGTSFLVGAGVSYKTLVPRLSNTIEITPETEVVTIDMADTTATLKTTPATTKTYRVDESISTLAAIAYTTIKLNPVTIKAQYRYGENISELVTVSGFAVREVLDETTGLLDYTPLVSHTVWGEIHTNGKNFQLGLFGGYLKNMGTKDKMSSVDNDMYGWATDIESLIRISPRLIWNSNKFRVALEVEFTEARYGKMHDENHVPEHVDIVQNYRTMLSTYYFF